MKYITDYGVLMELFLDVLKKDNPELHHKRFMRKITTKLEKFHRKRLPMCSASEVKVKQAVHKAEQQLAEMPTTISIGAIVCLIYSRYKDILKPYEFEDIDFQMLNKYSNPKGIIMQTAKVLNRIEENMK